MLHCLLWGLWEQSAATKPCVVALSMAAEEYDIAGVLSLPGFLSVRPRAAAQRAQNEPGTEADPSAAECDARGLGLDHDAVPVGQVERELRDRPAVEEQHDNNNDNTTSL